MIRAGGELPACALLASLAVLGGSAQQAAVNPGQLNESGHITAAGHSVPYLIRHLPVASFPELPPPIQAELNRRGCLIPQTYEARHPENVIHGSFEKPGSSDWAALCSEKGNVSLLVFFASAADKPSALDSSQETEHLQAHDPSGVLGFSWGIDSATPEQVREAQIGMEPRPPMLDHDSVAASVVEHRAVYHYYAKNAWKLVDMPE
jgi:hypothetical protein